MTLTPTKIGLEVNSNKGLFKEKQVFNNKYLFFYLFDFSYRNINKRYSSNICGV